jgi:hypothetical protein
MLLIDAQRKARFTWTDNDIEFVKSPKKAGTRKKAVPRLQQKARPGIGRTKKK